MIGGVVLVEYGGPEKKWPARFLKRQRQVLTEQAEKMEVVRYEVNVEDFEKWFAELKEPVKKYDIQPENMGFNIGGYMCAVTILRTARMGERQRRQLNAFVLTGPRLLLSSSSPGILIYILLSPI